jgi:hypothetical protein
MNLNHLLFAFDILAIRQIRRLGYEKKADYVKKV